MLPLGARGRMIVGGNEVYPFTPPWDTVSLLEDQCPLSTEEEGQAGGQAAGWRKPSTSARVTLSPKRSQQALERQRGMCCLMLEPCPFTQKHGPSFLKKVEEDRVIKESHSVELTVLMESRHCSSTPNNQTGLLSAAGGAQAENKVRTR
ncbi:hypothetical protein PAMP_007747 [Pampus punctatissimus]